MRLPPHLCHARALSVLEFLKENKVTHSTHLSTYYQI
jgi:hypothetical protein